MYLGIKYFGKGLTRLRARLDQVAAVATVHRRLRPLSTNAGRCGDDLDDRQVQYRRTKLRHRASLEARSLYLLTKSAQRSMITRVMDRPPPLQTRNSLSIFIHTLHLLDFDLISGWPNLAESTFSGAKSAVNVQARVKSTEWALYHLFRVYSPTETQTGLSANFPPTTPIQSKKLRGDLFKWLTELKSTGVLPRETVLRKTMFDDCQGEKFEELLARFAMVVLRKQLARQGGNGRALMAQEPDVDNLVPLVLAHRIALQRSLQTRQDLQDKASSLSQHLTQTQIDVERGLQQLEIESTATSDTRRRLSPRQLDLLHEKVDLAFASDRRWARFIFEGSSSFTNPTLLRSLSHWPFEEEDISAWQDESTDSTEGDADEPVRNLRALTSLHKDRLDRLTQLRDSLRSECSVFSETMGASISSEKSTETKTRAANAVSSIPKLRFNRHQELSLKF